MISLDKNWLIDDTPQYFEGVADKYATWKDVEYCLNNPQFFDLEFINNGEKLFVEPRQHVWSRPHIPKEVAFDLFNQGHGLVITNFEFVEGKQQILRDIERQFPTMHAAMHLYCGLTGAGSFNIHEDWAHNFIIQIEGETEWTVFHNRASYLSTEEREVEESELDVAINVVLKPGDLLYIPDRCYHRAKPDGKRLSLSIPMMPKMHVEHCIGENRLTYAIN